MAVDITGAMERGLDRVATRPGGVIVAAFVAVAVPVALLWETIIGRFVRDYGPESFFSFVPPAVAAELRQAWADYEVLLDVGIPVESLLALALLLWLARFVLRIGAVRWFVGEGTGGLESTLFTRRLGWTLLNLIAGTILYGAAVAVGLLALILPGVFLAVALFFFNFEVIVEGENAIDALANSYALTAGDRIELFLLGAVFVVLGTGVALTGNPAILPGRLPPVIVGSALTAALGVYGIATAADAYRQLQADEEPPLEAEDVADAPPTA